MEEIELKVADVSYKNLDGTSRQENIRKYAQPGLGLVLQLDPNNPHGAGPALEVLAPTPQGLLQVGLIRDAGLEEQIIAALQNGQRVDCQVGNITGGTPENPTLSLNVLCRVFAPGEEPPDQPAAAPFPVETGTKVLPGQGAIPGFISNPLFIIGFLIGVCFFIGIISTLADSLSKKTAAPETAGPPSYAATIDKIMTDTLSSPAPENNQSMTDTPPNPETVVVPTPLVATPLAGPSMTVEASLPHPTISNAGDRCVAASAFQIVTVRMGVQSKSPSNDVQIAWAVKSNKFDNTWFVAAKITGPDLGNGVGPAVWAVSGDQTSPGLTFSVDPFAKQYSSWTDASLAQIPFTMQDDGAKQAFDCANN